MSSPEKKPRDLNRLAFVIVEEATTEDDVRFGRRIFAAVDVFAAALGRKGGLKGGKERAAELTPEENRSKDTGWGFYGRRRTSLAMPCALS